MTRWPGMSRERERLSQLEYDELIEKLIDAAAAMKELDISTRRRVD